MRPLLSLLLLPLLLQASPVVILCANQTEAENKAAALAMRDGGTVRWVMGKSMELLIWRMAFLVVVSACFTELADEIAVRRDGSTHRVIGGSAISGYVTKGDNNLVRDPTRLTDDIFTGKVSAILNYPTP